MMNNRIKYDIDNIERILHRPDIHLRKTIILVIMELIFAGVIAIAIMEAGLYEKQKEVDNTHQIACFFSVYWKIQVVIFIATLRYIFIWLIKIYQRYASAETRLRCCMIPSCSEYAILALKKYGAIIGGVKTFRRLLRCHPPGGIDYP